jgi:hypothetical protein
MVHFRIRFDGREQRPPTKTVSFPNETLFGEARPGHIPRLQAPPPVRFFPQPQRWSSDAGARRGGECRSVKSLFPLGMRYYAGIVREQR